MRSASVPHLSPSWATSWNSLPRISFVSYIAQQWSSKGNNFFVSNCHGCSIILSLCVRVVIIISSCGVFFFNSFTSQLPKVRLFFSPPQWISLRRDEHPDGFFGQFYRQVAACSGIFCDSMTCQIKSSGSVSAGFTFSVYCWVVSPFKIHSSDRTSIFSSCVLSKCLFFFFLNLSVCLFWVFVSSCIQYQKQVFPASCLSKQVGA